MGHERDPLASARDPWNWRGGVARECLHLGVTPFPPPAVPSLTPAIELPPHSVAMALLAPIPHRRHRAKPDTSGAGGGGARDPDGLS
jgi:hypothetical protein